MQTKSTHSKELAAIIALNEKALAIEFDTPEEARVVAEQAYRLTFQIAEVTADVLYERARALMLGLQRQKGGVPYSADDEKMEQAKEALQLYTEIGKQKECLSVLVSIVLMHERRGEVAIALEQLALTVQLAERVGDDVVLGKALHRMGENYWRLGNIAQAIEFFRKSLEVAKKLRNHLGMASVLMAIGNVYSNAGNQLQALEHYMQALAMLAEHCPSDTQQYALVQMNMGTAFHRVGSREQALEYYLQSWAVYEVEEPDNDAIPLLCNIGKLYQENGNLALAEQYTMRALTMAETLHAHNFIPDCYAVMALLSLDRGEMALALERAQHAISSARQYEDSWQQAFALGVLGKVYKECGEYNSAQQHLEQSMALCCALGDIEEELNVVVVIAEVAIQQQRYQQAIALIEEALPRAEQVEYMLTAANLHKTLSDVYWRIGNGDKALHHFQQFYTAEKAVFNATSADRFRMIEVVHHAEKAQKEAEAYRAKNEQLQREVEHIRKDLLARALHIAQRTDALRETEKELKKMYQKSQKSGMRKDLKKILDVVGGALVDDDMWQVFEKQFRQLYSTFLDTLTQKYPLLSLTELRVCALIKISMSSKEIGHVLHISARSVDTYRYRIRQKLGITGEDNLAQILSEMA